MASSAHFVLAESSMIERPRSNGLEPSGWQCGGRPVPGRLLSCVSGRQYALPYLWQSAVSPDIADCPRGSKIAPGGTTDLDNSTLSRAPQETPMLFPTAAQSTWPSLSPGTVESPSAS